MTLDGVVRLWVAPEGRGYVRVRPAGSNLDVRFKASALVGTPSLQRGDRVRVTLQTVGRRYVVLTVEPERSVSTKLPAALSSGNLEP